MNTAVSSMRANRNEVIAWMLDFQTIKQEFGDLRKYCSNARFVYMTKSFVDKIITGKREPSVSFHEKHTKYSHTPYYLWNTIKRKKIVPKTQHYDASR